MAAAAAPCASRRSFRDSFLPSFSQSSSDPSLRWTPPRRSSSSAPASDDRFWDGLRTRVDTILEDHRLITSAASTCTVASGRPKRLRENSLMLVRGLDSIAMSFVQLSDTLTDAHKGVNALASCSSQARERESGEEESDAKRHYGGASTKFAALETFSLPFYNLRLNQSRPPHFPSLLPGTQDYNQQRPSQELVPKDLHDTKWKFCHIYRGATCPLSMYVDS
ncbi:hypothetical protein ZWY2020_041139 [Hordeum vulgare]|nr:hypothetical protein ZWY2020_041139 [Hordeum vulgare]